MIVNEDIELKPINVEEAPCIFSIIENERDYLREWLPFIDASQSVEYTEDYIKSVISNDNKQFVIYYRTKGIGIIGFKETDFYNQKTEIGYWMSQYMQGKGIMTLSVRRMLEFAFEEQGINRVQIKAAVDNKKSRAIPERLGFKQEGIERDGELLINNMFTDIAIYSLLKKEFKA